MTLLDGVLGCCHNSLNLRFLSSIQVSPVLALIEVVTRFNNNHKSSSRDFMSCAIIFQGKFAATCFLTSIDNAGIP